MFTHCWKHDLEKCENFRINPHPINLFSNFYFFQRHLTYKIYIYPLTYDPSQDEVFRILNFITVKANAVKEVEKIGNVGVVTLTSRAVADYVIGGLEGESHRQSILE